MLRCATLPAVAAAIGMHGEAAQWWPLLARAHLVSCSEEAQGAATPVSKGVAVGAPRGQRQPAVFAVKRCRGRILTLRATNVRQRFVDALHELSVDACRPHPSCHCPTQYRASAGFESLGQSFAFAGKSGRG